MTHLTRFKARRLARTQNAIKIREKQMTDTRQTPETEKEILDKYAAFLGYTPMEIEAVGAYLKAQSGKDLGRFEDALKNYCLHIGQVGRPVISGSAFEEQRKLWGFSPSEISMLLGFKGGENARSHVHNMESGRRAISPTVSMLMRYMISYGLPFDAPIMPKKLDENKKP